MKRKTKLQKEYFDTYYDVEESLSEMIQEELDKHYKKKPRSKHNLESMKQIRDKVVKAVAEIKGIDAVEIKEELEAIRKG